MRALRGFIRTEPAVLDAASLAHFPLGAIAVRRHPVQRHDDANVVQIGGNLSALNAIPRASEIDGGAART